MLFGRTLYGGALLPRQYTAEGAVTCTANVAASPHPASRPAKGTAAGVAAVQATATRRKIPGAATTATATVLPLGARSDRRPGALAAGTATAAALPRAAFSGFIGALATAAASCSIERRTPVRYNAPLVATASGIADGDLYALAWPSPAQASARPFGTHWFVGQIDCAITSLAAADAQRVKAAQGEAVCFATGQAVVRGDLYGRATPTGGVAGLDLDPLQIAGGVRYWDARGVAQGVFAGSAAPYVYSVALSVGRATLAVAPNLRFMARAHAVAAAAPRCDAQIVVPQLAQLTVESDAVASVSARIAAFGVAQVGATGAGTATPLLEAAGAGNTAGAANARANVVDLAVRVATQAGAGATGKLAREARTLGAVGVMAQVAGRATSILLGSTGAVGLVQATGAGDFHPKLPVSGQVEGVATPDAQYRLAFRVSGVAIGEASPWAVNLVNDARQPLASRRVDVGAEPRLVTVVATSRTLEIQTAARRMAA